MLTTDGQRHDLPLDETPNVRYYLFSSFPHGAGTAAGICQQPQNPLAPDQLLRALLLDLDDWVSTGREPPRNRVPRLADRTLAPALPQSGRDPLAISPGSFTMGFTTPVICGISDRGSTTASLQYCRRNCSALRIKCMCQRRTPTITISPAFTHPTSPCRLPPIPAGHYVRRRCRKMPMAAMCPVSGCLSPRQERTTGGRRPAPLSRGALPRSYNLCEPGYGGGAAPRTGAPASYDDVQAYIAAAQAASIP